MGLSREEWDRLVDEHFEFEARDEISGVLDTMTEDAEHEVIPSPLGSIRGTSAIRSYYELLFSCLGGESVTPIRRLYGDDFMIDESLWHGHIEDGKVFLCEGRSGYVSFRLLHIFEIRDGKISSEQVWCDLEAIQRQLR